ncbi:MAG: Uma2 family endonuclease [Chloroherpetonaceae bacterium]|nr:Uma2 family endonuclease [Chloroherpetonaceae bacterium]MDW8437164.1 Uma2 family endonuclease [Chloroherpetonaceae bacterium]
MSSARQSAYILPEHYLEMEYHSPYKNEYYDGEVRAMGYASDAHGLIVVNVIDVMLDCFRKKGCRVYPSERMVYIEACNAFVYPDVVVVCGEPQYRTFIGKMLATTNPTILVEVLSESTAKDDRERKLPCYRQMPSARHILFVESERKFVEHHQRVSPTQWLVSELSASDALALDDCAFPIEKFYDQIEFRNSL